MDLALCKCVILLLLLYFDDSYLIGNPLQANYIPPESGTLEKFRQYFRLMEEAYSPIKKLEHLLDIVRTIYETVSFMAILV